MTSFSKFVLLYSLLRRSRRRRRIYICAPLLLVVVVSWRFQNTSTTRQEITVVQNQVQRNSCTQLGIQKLTNSMHANESVHNWRAGFYEYEHCAAVTTQSEVSLRGGKTVVLMPMDKSYVDVIRDWSFTVRSAHLRCYVFALSAELCAVASKHDCECLMDPSLTTISSNYPRILDPRMEKGWHPMRVNAVKMRFWAASELINRGFNVIMHDADVFFHENSLLRFVEYVGKVRARTPDIDMIVQDNGLRKVPYDRLNWGFVWLRAGQTSLNILTCTLNLWQDNTFLCHGEKCDMSYYLRSQPRINRIIEETIRRNVSAPKICMITRSSMKNYGIQHMTGYTSAQMKQTCGKASGYLRRSNLGASTIAFDVPPNASSSEQKTALMTAITIARLMRRNVEIPTTFYLGKHTPFCMLYEILDDTIHELLSTRATLCSKENTIRMLDVLVPPPWPHFPTNICLPFEDIKDGGTIGYDAELQSSNPTILLCNPSNMQYAPLHMCQRSHKSDEV